MPPQRSGWVSEPLGAGPQVDGGFTMFREEPDQRRKVLFLSNDPNRAGKRCAQLSQAGWDAVLVADPMEALAAAKSGKVDLALLHMSVDAAIDMDFPKILRRVCERAYLPVIIVAETLAESQRCDFLNSGADDIICEETSAAEMVARIRAMLRVKELHDELAASKAALGEALQRERKLLADSRRDNAHLRVLCTTDPLTHVQNVRSFHDILDHEFKMASRYEHSLSLLTLDVDYFKLVNDTYGHPVGDQILKELAVIFRQSVRESDVVARTGGEEFSVVLPKADRRKAMQFARRIRKHVASHNFAAYGQDVKITLSIGSATYPADAEITETHMLLYFADQALLAAKQAGRDRVLAVDDLDMTVRRRLRRQYLEMPPALAGVWPDEAEDAYSRMPTNVQFQHAE